jgi:hypothetical protein
VIQAGLCALFFFFSAFRLQLIPTSLRGVGPHGPYGPEAAFSFLSLHPIQYNYDPAFSHEQQVLRGTPQLGGIRVADDKFAALRP